jgi:hypothetical protein
MKSFSLKFCPKCGEYWFPLADYVSRPFKSPPCRKCNVPVEPTGLALMLTATLTILSVGFWFGLMSSSPEGDMVGGIAFYLIMFLAIVQWVRQAKARRKSRKQCG